MYIRRSSTVLVLLSIAPLVHLLNINNLNNEKSSKLKITPLYCVSPRYENVTGVCMLSLECKEKNGTIIGSCFNQYLMGACCHDPTYGLNVTSTTTEMTLLLANSSTPIPNTSPHNNTNGNATAVDSDTNTTTTQTTQSLSTTLSSTTLAFPSTTTRPFSQITTAVRESTKNGTSSIKMNNGVNNKSSSSVKKHRKKGTSSSKRKKNKGKIKSNSTEKSSSSSTTTTATNKRKTAPNLVNKGKKKGSASAPTLNNATKNHKTNATTVKTTKKPSKNTVVPNNATPAINNKKTTTAYATTIRTTEKMTTPTTPESITMKITTKSTTTTLATTTILSTTIPTTTTTTTTPTTTTTIPTTTTTIPTNTTTIPTTTTTIPTTTTTIPTNTTTIPTTTTTIPTNTTTIPTTTTTIPTTTTTIPTNTTTIPTTTTTIPTTTTTIPTTTTTIPTTTITTTITTTTITTTTPTTAATVPTTSTTEVSTTKEIDSGRIEISGKYPETHENPEETTFNSIFQGNKEHFDDQTENSEHSHEPNNSIEVDSSNNSDAFFSDEDSSSMERSHEIVGDSPTENNKTTLSTPLTFPVISSSTESATVPSTTISTTIAAPTVYTTTTTTTTARPTHKSKRRKHKKKGSSKRQSTTTTTEIPSTKRTTQPPETSTKKSKKHKKKGTTEIATFYITPTRKHYSTTEKSSFSLSEDELDSDIDDFINQVVQSLAESLDGSPIDESLNKLQSSNNEKDISSSKLPSISRKPSKKNSTEKIWDFKRDCGIRPLVKSGRIVGGTPSKFGAWPWHALIKETTWWGIFSKVKCGGVLISHRFVLTAGHCKPTTGGTLTVALGVTNTETDSSANIMNVRRFITHPRFNPKTYDNDIAIVELDRPVEYQPHIVPICMPNSEEVFEGKKAIVTGMGLLRHDGERPLNLHEVDVPILENEDCQQMFAVSGNPKPIRDSFICAGYAHGRKDSCGGDSGGGLQLQRASGQWVLAGTVSHGIKCALPNQPGVYMRMTYYKPWINRVIAMASKGRHEFFRPNPAMLGHPKTPASEGMLSDFILKLLKMIGRFWSSGRIPD